MIPEEKRDIEKISSDFLKLKKKKRLTVQDEDKLIDDATALLGIYAIDKNEKILKLIEEMISFGEKQNWAIQGTKIELDHIKKGLIKVKKK